MKWKKTEERLPKSMVPVLACWKKENYFDVIRIEDFDGEGDMVWTHEDEGVVGIPPSHWTYITKPKN